METKDFKKTKGITLIALVVTILILLILAGVSIVTLTGDNGILNQVQNASKLSEIARVEEEANLILTASIIDNRTSAKAIKDVGTILSELKADGKIENYGTTGNVAVTEIKFDTSSITIGQEDNQTLTATFLPVNTAGGYYVVVKGKKYPVSKENDKIEIGKTEITTDGSSTRVISDVESDDEEIAMVEKVGTDGVKITGVVGGTANITVKYSQSITTTISVTVKTKYTVNLYASSEATTPTPIKVVEGTSAFNAIGYTVPEAPEGQQFDKWLLKTAIQGQAKDTDATQLLTGNDGVTQDLYVYATFKDIPIAFRNYGTPENSTTYGNMYSLTTGTEKIKVDINNTPSDETDDVEVADNWKIFYEDSDFLYLIYADYYPVVAQTMTETNNLIFAESTADYPYAVYASSQSNRVNLLQYLRNNSGYSWSLSNNNFASNGVEYLSWSKLKSAIRGLSKMSGKTISVQGSPDIDLWLSSWNAKANTELKATKEGSGYNIMLNQTNASNSAYYIMVSTDDNYNTTASETDKTGYYDELYFPYRSYTKGDGTTGNAHGYWLASPSGAGPYSMFCVGCNGLVGGSTYSKCNNIHRCTRPVIAILKSAN